MLVEVQLKKLSFGPSIIQYRAQGAGVAVPAILS